MPQSRPNLLDLLGEPAVDKEADDTQPKCGVIMNLDGSIRLFTRNMDALSTENSPEIAAMARKLMALATALSNDQVMKVLDDLVDTIALANMETINGQPA